MRILYLKTQIGIGGLERIITDKINYLVQNKEYDIAYAYFGDGTESSPYVIDKRVKFYPINIKACGGLSIKIKSVWNTYTKIKEIIKDFNPDIIENADCVVATWILPFIKRNIPKILECHQSFEGVSINDKKIYKGNKFKIKVNKLLRHLIYPLYDCMIVLTPADKQAWGFKNIQVIGNFTKLKPQQQQIVGGSNCSHIAIAVGRLSYQKNFDLLIESWRIVHIHHPDWKLQIWGEGPQHMELQNLINKLSLSEIVKLCGQTTEMNSVYENATIFILPSRFEGFPLVISEAMQFGLPCVSFSIDAVAGRVIDGETGFCADNTKRTPEELGETICKCIESVEKSNFLSINAYNVIQQYDINKIMECWIYLFKNVYNKKC